MDPVNSVILEKDIQTLEYPKVDHSELVGQVFLPDFEPVVQPWYYNKWIWATTTTIVVTVGGYKVYKYLKSK